MKKLFLTASFSDVANLFTSFAGNDISGKTVTFIPTASVPEFIKFYVDADRKALKKLGLIIDELELTKATDEEIKDKLTKNDLIYVSGGNTFFLLQELKRTGADVIIKEQINLGKLYIGASAGSIVTSPDITYVKTMDNYKKAKNFKDYKALSLVDFYTLPHHTNFPFARKVENIISEYESVLNLVPISNSQAILVNGDNITII